MNHRVSAAIVSLGIVFAASLATAQERPQARAPDQYGRYVVTFSPFARADSFLLDTQTGRVWQLTRFTDLEGEPLIWKNMERIDSEAQLMQWLRSQAPKTSDRPRQQ